ncbi:iron permease [Neolentinus lepideus HHB14362 ss-1]|uniref:Iron permease n=1 Tax=Neolentinus lepideus HHB14362 ss-1 TaxID=1314782 RepID=A0A165RQB2_9AGAM|nr:iron permease [Neolentinus lepideus HHB14362 ss-1]
MVLIGNWTCDFLSALEITALSTTLPTIAQHLKGGDFIWAGTVPSLGSTAILPLCGALALAFGRKHVLISVICLFAAGCAICGAAVNMPMLIVGRAFQGMGGGGILTMTEIIFSDMVPLKQRGIFLSISASVWALASAIGPPVGGALASTGHWRWLFFLNLPICAVAVILQCIFYNVKTPKESVVAKLRSIDWIGNIVLIGSVTAIVMAFTWGGVTYAWSSYQVLVALCVGLAGFFVFFVYEAYFCTKPTIPWSIVMNRTSMSGYLCTFIHGIPINGIIYYMPVYFQAVKVASPIRSGVDVFGLCFTVAPFGILCGALVQISKKYRPANWTGWVLMTIGCGLLTLLNENSTIGQFVGYQIVAGAGAGIVWTGTLFPILAPLPYSNNTGALAFYMFTKCLSTVFGIMVGGTILQNELRRRLPVDFTAKFPAGAQLAYSAIPLIRNLGVPLRNEVIHAFAESTRLIWITFTAISGLGLVCSLFMKEVSMQTKMDEQWALQSQSGATNVETETKADA